MRREAVASWCGVVLLGIVCGGSLFSAEPSPAEPSPAEPSPAEPSPGDLVKISATIYRVGEDGKEKVLAEPTMITTLGQWAKVRHGKSMSLPTEYSLPNIPKEAAERIEQKEKDGKPLFKTNEDGVVIPSHPEKFETIPLGVTARFRPRLLTSGNLVVESEIEYRKFEGWINEGTEIFFEESKPGGKTKRHVVATNSRKRHVVTEESAKFHYVRKPGEDSGVVLPVTNESTKSESRHLQVRVEAEWLPKPTEQGDPVPAGHDFFVTTKFMELSYETEPGEDFFPKNPVLSDAEFQMWVRKIAQRKGVDLLSAPSIVMRPGQEGVVEVVREFIYPTTYDPPEIPGDAAEDGETISRSFAVTPASPTKFDQTNVGVSMAITARPAKGKGFVDLMIEPRVNEFSEFSDYSQPVRTWHPPGIGSPKSVVVSENQIQMPIFETVSMQTFARIPNGSSIVLGGFVREEIQDVEDKIPILGDLPLIGRFSRTQTELHIKKRLLFVITVTSLDTSELEN